MKPGAWRPDMRFHQAQVPADAGSFPANGSFPNGTFLSPNETKITFQASPKGLSAVGPTYAKDGCMKVAAKQEEDPKALDYFTTTIIPVRTLRAVAVLTLKHAVLLVGFTAGVIALVRFVLAD
jgi:hypothetical protein